MKRLFGVLAATLLVGSAAAETLTIGVSQETSSTWPNAWISTPNQQIASNMFNNLTEMDHQNRLQPGLAVSWAPLDDQTWEFKLREGVKFQDGTPFTADHVVLSFDHAKEAAIKGVSGSGNFIADKTYKKVDDFTFHISAGEPFPLMPNQMSIVYMYPHKASVEDFNSGKAAVGSGPYKFVEWVKGDRLVMERNDGFWGEKPEFDRVIFKPIKADPSRVASLLSGQVDMIDQVPTTDVNLLKKNKDLRVVSTAGERIIMLQMDASRDISPFILTDDGKPFFPSPMRKWEVRKAISKAINRDAIVDRVMEGNAVPAAQVAAPGMFGFNPDMKPEPFDPEGAKKLLAQVGLGDGFRLTLHCPNDRYINDEKICEAVAGMLTRVGIKTDLQTFPKAVYFTKARAGGEGGTAGFSLWMMGFGTVTGETMSQHWTLLHTLDREKQLGHVNFGGYSNLRMDFFLREAMKTLDDAKREKMLHEAAEMYMRDVALIPLHYQVNIWAMRKGITYQPRLMEVTHARHVKSAN